MKLSKNWLQELVDLKVPLKEVERLLPLRTIATKEITDDFIELDMKGYNRADLLSLRGIAYEIAAITDSKVTFLEPNESEYIWLGQNLPNTPVKVEDENLSPIQCVVKISGLTLADSPKDWIQKLKDSGMRSVNNITDITNLIMLEYGQPLHSFDASTVKNDTINVRLAHEGEEIVTLDNKVRKLKSSDIVLADEEKALDVAGVMGGEDTEITASTTTILLSASLFNPQRIRKTSTRLGFTSEASKRFIHGLTQKRLFQALQASINMYLELGGKVEAITIVGDKIEAQPKIALTETKINSLIGVDLDPKQVEEYLTKLNFSVKKADQDWIVTPPYWRTDISIEEDLIEEIARMYGYEKIPAKELKGELPPKVDQTLFDLIFDLKTKLVDLGLTEVQTYSFYSTDVLKNLNWDKKNLVKIANPISSETQYMREDIWPNLVEVIAKNFKKGFNDMAIFEIGKTFHMDEKGKPCENFRLSIALFNNTNNPIPELFSIFEQLKIGTKLEKLKALDRTKGGYENKFFHPNRFKFIGGESLNDSRVNPIGGIAELHQRYSDNFGIKNRVAILEIELDELLK